MACTGCGNDYGIFKKEVGCQMCGFSFCTRCCGKQSYSNENGEVVKQLICNKCYDAVTKSQPASTSRSPPLAHKKRMAELKNRSMSLGYEHATDEWSNKKDKEIIERLQKLKRDRFKDTQPSQVEIEERLAKLKGMDPAKFTAPPIMVYRPADKRSAVEQTDDLIKQIAEEVQLDSKYGCPEDEIAARLARLRGESVPKVVTETVVPSTFENVESDNSELEDIQHEGKKFSDECQNLEQKTLDEIKSLQKDKDYKQVLKSKSAGQKSESDDEADEDEEANAILEKLLAVGIESSDIDDPDSLNGGKVQSPDDTKEKKSPSEEDEDEFPWCVICTEDAKIRCFGCDNDLYCLNCFRECHDSLDIKDHKTCPFLSPKKL